MTNYQAYDPIIIDNLLVDDNDVSTTSLPMYFGAVEPCDLYWTVDGASQLVASATLPLAHGVAAAGLPKPKWPLLFSPDDTNVIKAKVVFGDPQSVSEADFLLGKNIAYIGAAGRWEAVYYRDVTTGSDGTVTLSRLLRCQKGSWYAGYQHTLKDTIVFGNDGFVRFDRPLSDLGKTAQTKIVPSGYPIGTKTGLGGPMYVGGGSIRPWAPIDPYGVRSGSDVVLSWTRVDRAPTTMHDGNDYTPLTDSPERYTLAIWAFPMAQADPPLRVLTGLTAPTYTYLAADMATDGTTGAHKLVVMIMQESALVGRGWPFLGRCNVDG